MAAVVFTVDATTRLGHPAISSAEIAAGAARHHDVLIPFGSVDPLGAAAVDDARRLVEESGVRGFKFHPTVQGFDPSDERHYPLYAALQELGVVALFHTGQTGIGAGLPGGYGLRLGLSNPILLDPVAADFPDLQIVMAHPSVPWQEEALSVATHKRNTWIDLSGWSPKYFPAELVRYANSMLKHRVLFGSDFPMLTPDRWITDAEQTALKPEVMPGIMRDNAARLLGLAIVGPRMEDTLDRYGLAEHLSPAAYGVLQRLEQTLRRDIRPLLAEAWERAELPDAFSATLVPLRLMDPPELAGTGEADTTLFAGVRNFVLAKTDASLATWYNAQSGLFRTAVTVGGSPEQAARLDPLIRTFDVTGVFALTEPLHGSDIAGGLATRARREGGEWVIDGAKRWIGGASTADLLAVFARDDGDGRSRRSSCPAMLRACGCRGSSARPPCASCRTPTSPSTGSESANTTACRACHPSATSAGCSAGCDRMSRGSPPACRPERSRRHSAT